MRTVIVEDVETAEAKKQRLATTAVDAALEILRTEASGLVIEAAAPLVFQEMCIRDSLYRSFSKSGNPTLQVLLDSLRAVGLTLVVAEAKDR